jgi:hypothetical protein
MRGADCDTCEQANCLFVRCAELPELKGEAGPPCPPGHKVDTKALDSSLLVREELPPRPSAMDLDQFQRHERQDLRASFDMTLWTVSAAVEHTHFTSLPQ